CVPILTSSCSERPGALTAADGQPAVTSGAADQDGLQTGTVVVVVVGAAVVVVVFVGASPASCWAVSSSSIRSSAASSSSGVDSVPP
ncbi:MAG: hypothetical protein P8J30_00575, partial [Ilumatobacter sp.]|nr:hypothetical protein [Ilumatobacter sp.]